MGKSQRTENLEKDIKEIEEKLKSLKSAEKKVSGCKTKVKHTYNEADSDHVDGDKYIDMYDEDQKLIKESSKALKSKKDDVLSELKSSITSLTILKQVKETELAVSRQSDAIKDALDAAAKFLSGK